MENSHRHVRGRACHHRGFLNFRRSAFWTLGLLKCSYGSQPSRQSPRPISCGCSTASALRLYHFSIRASEGCRRVSSPSASRAVFRLLSTKAKPAADLVPQHQGAHGHRRSRAGPMPGHPASPGERAGMASAGSCFGAFSFKIGKSPACQAEDSPSRRDLVRKRGPRSMSTENPLAFGVHFSRK